MKIDNGVKIMMTEGSDIKKLQEGRIITLEYKGVFANSMVLEKLISLGLNINKLNKTADVIAVEFNNVYTSEKADKILKEINDYKIEVNYQDFNDRINSLTRQRKPIKDKLDKGNLSDEEKSSLDAELSVLNESIKTIRTEKKPHQDKIKSMKDSIKDEVMNKQQIRNDIYNNGFKLNIPRKSTVKAKDINEINIKTLAIRKSVNITRYNKKNKKKIKLIKLSYETIEYVYWFRSPSKSKQGDVLCINKKFFSDINEWQNMGIELKEDDNGNVKLVENEAYKSLTSSALISAEIEGKVTINPFKEILVLNDLESYSEHNCILVKTYKKDDIFNMIEKVKTENPNENIDEKEYMKLIGKTYTERDKYKLKNVLFDGQALLDDSLFGSAPNDKIQWVNGEYINNSFLVLRQHYFKACGFRSKIQQFFIDYCNQNDLEYSEFKVVDRYGRELNAKDIKMITTENAMKWEKFLGETKEAYENWCDHVQADNDMFSICKVDHNSKWKNMQQASYQFINSLPISKLEDDGIDYIQELCKPTINYMNSLKGLDSIENYINYLEMTKNDLNSHQMMLDLYNHNKKFANSFLFREYKRKTLYSYKEEKLKNGKLLFEANNLTVVGNPYAMLLHSVKALDKKINGNILDDWTDETLPIINEGTSVYTERFKHGEKLASFRSPHNSPNGIGYNENFKHELMQKYFVFNENVMAVNFIKTNEQDRKNGEDTDSDFNYVSNDETLVNCALKAQEFDTIVNLIDKEPNHYKNTLNDKSRLDHTLSKSKNEIGLSSNLAQIALSYYWDNPSMELEGYVAILSVLAQVAIDNSKRRYNVKVGSEISRIRKKIKGANNELKLPMFWKYTNESIDLEDEKQVKLLVKMNCPMDKIYNELEKIEDDSKKDRIADTTFLNAIKGDKTKEQYDKIVSAVVLYDNKIKELNLKKKNTKKDWEKENIERDKKNAYKDLNEKLDKITKTSPKTIQMLIKECLTTKGALKGCKKVMLRMLHKHFCKNFMKCFAKEIKETKKTKTKK